MKIKTHIILTVIVSITLSLTLPIFCKWYEQVTGIMPIAFVVVSFFAFVLNIFYIVNRLDD
jgi:hypothetical protein